MKADKVCTVISAEYVLHDALGRYCMENGLTEEELTFEYNPDLNVLTITVRSSTW